MVNCSSWTDLQDRLALTPRKLYKFYDVKYSFYTLRKPLFLSSLSELRFKHHINRKDTILRQFAATLDLIFHYQHLTTEKTTLILSTCPFFSAVRRISPNASCCHTFGTEKKLSPQKSISSWLKFWGFLINSQQSVVVFNYRECILFSVRTLPIPASSF